jgi:ABC-type nitrate/sulfonate/bicarbonate transport system substrate-binding protein
MSRLRIALVPAVVAALALAVAACGSDSSSSSTSGGAATTSGAAKTEKVRIALDYSPNVNYLGIYTAIAKGFFAKHGVEPEIIPYANTPAETLIKSGKTDLGITYPPDVVINRSQGLKYKAVGALVANNSTALAVLADSKYTRPSQLSGELYGGFGIQSDKPIVSAILAADGAQDPQFKQVVLNTDVITALSKKRIGYTAVFGGIDDVTAELQGVKLRTFPYAKYLGAAGNYPNAVYVASDDDIAQRGPALKGALAALAEGYEYSVAHPDEAEQILIDANQTALGKSEDIVHATGAAVAKQFLDDSGHWGPLQDEDFVGLGQILKDGGVVKGAVPPPADLYTNSLLPSAQ